MRRRALLSRTAFVLVVFVCTQRPNHTAAEDLTAEASRLVEVLELHSGMTVADVGAGDGEMSVAIAGQLGSDSRVYSTDIDPERLRALRTAAKGLPNMVVVEGAAKETKLPDGCCDAIFLRTVYHHIGDPAAMNASLRRSLKPGGMLAVIDFAPDGHKTAEPGHRASGNSHGVMAETVSSELMQAGFEHPTVLEDWPGKLFLVLVRNPSLTRNP